MSLNKNLSDEIVFKKFLWMKEETKVKIQSYVTAEIIRD